MAEPEESLGRVPKGGYSSLAPERVTQAQLKGASFL